MKSNPVFDRKPSAIAATVLAALALVVAMAFIVTVGIVLTGTRCTLAAIRRRSRKKVCLSNLYMLPKDHGQFNIRTATAKTSTAGQQTVPLGELYQIDKIRDVLAA